MLQKTIKRISDTHSLISVSLDSMVVRRSLDVWTGEKYKFIFYIYTKSVNPDFRRSDSAEFTIVLSPYKTAQLDIKTRTTENMDILIKDFLDALNSIKLEDLAEDRNIY